MNPKGQPFVYPGVTWVENCKTAADVMSAAKLDFTVEKCEVMARMPYNWDIENKKYSIDDFCYQNNNIKLIDNQYAIYRTDKNIPLGLVKGRYTPVQNIDAFNFFDDCIGKDKAIWQTAGCFDEGKRVFVSAKLPDTITIGGDPVENYLVFVNSHDGSSGVKIMLTPIRLICQNMLSAAIHNADSYISIRHTKTVHEKIYQANEILGLCRKKIITMKDLYNEMYKIKCSDNDALNLFGNVILTTAELQTIKDTGHTIKQLAEKLWSAIDDTQISMKKVNMLNSINHYYHTGIGQKQIMGTRWGAFNAVTGYFSNIENNEGTKRMDTLLFGDRSRKIELAGDLALQHQL